MRAQNRRNGAPQGALYLFGCVFRRPDLSAKLRAERVVEGFGVACAMIDRRAKRFEPGHWRRQRWIANQNKMERRVSWAHA